MRRFGLALAAVVTVVGLSACTETGVSAADAYKIGCPAVDSALGGGTAVNKISVTGLKALRDTNQLGPEAQTWLEAVIATLESSRPEDMPPEAKKLIVDGCKQNGYELQNI